MQWAAVDIPDPETPVGARGIGEPPVRRRLRGAERDFRRARRRDLPARAGDADTILTSLEAGQPVTEALTANI